MKDKIRELVFNALDHLYQQGKVLKVRPESINIERPRNDSHGDFTTNIALQLASREKISPRECAEDILEIMPNCEFLERCEIAGPGFINFYVQAEAYLELIDEIRNSGPEFGQSRHNNSSKVLIEFVSSNPTGPLHVGHGRGAAFGDALARILAFAGYDVQTEYYVNDAGRQMDILTVSVWLRYLEDHGLVSEFPNRGYQGDYIRKISKELNEKYTKKFALQIETLFQELPDDDEAIIDELIRRTKNSLGDDYQVLFDLACRSMVQDIQQDLTEFGVVFDRWFHESQLVNNGDIESALTRLEENGYLYERDDAVWFRSTDFEDDKDRVVVRANGSKTYFASDIAYHYNKAERNYDQIINIFGADHHGYTKRIEASFQAMGNPADRLEFLMVQFAVLYRGSQKVSMSTREGEFVSLRELREEVGNDAARFFYVLRRSDQHMDFDLDLAKSESSENPVFYIQYAHARIASVFELVKDKAMETPDSRQPAYQLLVEKQEAELLRTLSQFPDIVLSAARSRAPHLVAYYLRNLAQQFHAYYNEHPFLSSENELRLARLGLIDAIRVVIANGLGILGVSAPLNM
ncbi:MAG: arginine--tRNA ligase [Gammaproteobacteria bacterium]|nr:arginine--tRNA ligase [Gammaproteobacteria bacterium]MCY4217858.1 arginine--tRNA ligase [Gammaproteobacteria bacterium]MCY4274958.1 arginine--tRNA ligase [Gammaproteobacteria bacterium]